MECNAMFYGSVTVGERGQIVIPSEARAEMGFVPGDKLLVAKHPIYRGLMVFKFEAVREFMDEMMKNVEALDARSKEEDV